MRDVRIEFFSPTGVPRMVDESFILKSPTWEYLEQGGMGQARIPILANWEGTDYSAIPVEAGDTVKIWVEQETYPRFWGIVAEPNRSLATSETLLLVAFGFMERMNGVKMRRQQLTYPGYADLSVYAQDILDDFNAKLGTDYDSDFEDTGIFLSVLSLDKATCRQAMDTLFEIGEGAVVWGWEVSPIDGQPRMYLRKRDNTVGWDKAVGDGVKLLSGRKPLSDVFNALSPAVGGKARFPNTLGEVMKTETSQPNTALDYPIPFGIKGNILQNPSFDEMNWGLITQPAYWIITAEVLTSASHTSSWAVLLEPGESVQQSRSNTNLGNDVKILPGKHYRLSVWARQAVGGETRTATVTLTWLDSSNTVLDTGTFAIDTTTAIWQEFPLNPGGIPGLVLTAPTDAYTVNVKLEGDGSGSGVGVICDDIALYRIDNNYQPGWTTIDAFHHLAEVNWSAIGGYGQAQYSVYLRSSGTGFTGVGSADGAGGKLLPKQSYRAGIWYKSPAGATDTPALQINVFPKKADGSYAIGGTDPSQTVSIAASGSPTTDWTLLEIADIAPDNTATGVVTAGLTTAGEILFSCLYLMDSSATGGFIRGNTFERWVTVQDGDMASLLLPAAAASLTDNDLRETSTEFPALVDWDAQGKQIIASWLNRNAVLQEPRRLELDDDIDLITPGLGQIVHISGTGDTLSPQWPSRVACTWNGKLAQSIELGDPQPVLTTAIKRLGGSTNTSVSGSVASSELALQQISTAATPPVMVGATDSDNGVAGLVPAPSAGDEGRFLRGDATWASPTGWNVVARDNTTDTIAVGDYALLTLTADHTFDFPTPTDADVENGRGIRIRLEDSGTPEQYIATLSSAGSTMFFYSGDANTTAIDAYSTSYYLGPTRQDVEFVAVTVDGNYGWRVINRYPYFRTVTNPSTLQPGDHARYTTGSPSVGIPIGPERCPGERIIIDNAGATYVYIVANQAIGNSSNYLFRQGGRAELQSMQLADGTYEWAVISAYRCEKAVDVPGNGLLSGLVSITTPGVDNDFILMALTGARTVTLPSATTYVAAGTTYYPASAYYGRELRVVKTTTGAITVQRSGSDTIDGATSVTSPSADYGAFVLLAWTRTSGGVTTAGWSVLSAK